MKNLMVLFVVPFLTIVICFLLVSAVFIAPFFLIGYIYTTAKRKERRTSENYPIKNEELKKRVKEFLKAREVRM